MVGWQRSPGLLDHLPGRETHFEALTLGHRTGNVSPHTSTGYRPAATAVQMASLPHSTRPMHSALARVPCGVDGVGEARRLGAVPPNGMLVLNLV